MPTDFSLANSQHHLRELKIISYWVLETVFAPKWQINSCLSLNLSYKALDHLCVPYLVYDYFLHLHSTSIKDIVLTTFLSEAAIFPWQQQYSRGLPNIRLLNPWCTTKNCQNKNCNLCCSYINLIIAVVSPMTINRRQNSCSVIINSQIAFT